MIKRTALQSNGGGITTSTTTNTHHATTTTTTTGTIASTTSSMPLSQGGNESNKVKKNKPLLFLFLNSPFFSTPRGKRIVLLFVTVCTLILWCLVSIMSNMDLQLQQPSQYLHNMLSPVPPLDVGRKEGTPIILNIGSNLDPIVPRPMDDPCTVSLAFEPIVGHQIPPHPALHVIHAAVSYEGGWSAMNLYNKDGRSSSLNKASHQAAWSNQNRWNKKSHIQIVPTISFRTILESLQHYDIQMILTDMQGHDFKSVSSVGDYLAQVGVRRLVTEVYKDNVSSYKDAHNDLCRDWLPHMTSIGYVFEGLTNMRGDVETLLDGYRNAQEVKETCEKERKEHPVETAGLSEYNAYWRLESEPPMPASFVSKEKENEGGAGASPIDVYMYGTHSPKMQGHMFAKEEYEKCATNYMPA